MNILTFSDALIKRLGEIDQTRPDQHDLARIAAAVSETLEIMMDLKMFTSTYVFHDAAEEIKFFKEVKPVLLSQHLFYKRLFQLKLHESFYDRVERIKNYRGVLRKLRHFANKNKLFYEYCMSGATHLDATYFSRGNYRSGLHRDQSFTTGFDMKLSKILAYELLRKYIIKSIRLYETETRDFTPSTLSWTDSKVGLVELIYALHAGGVFNDGQADIKQIIDAFEQMFSMNFGNYARTFAEIRIRKSGPTNFLDSLRERLAEFIAAT